MEHNGLNEKLVSQDMLTEYQEHQAALEGLSRWHLIKRFQAHVGMFKHEQTAIYTTNTPERAVPPVKHYPLTHPKEFK